VRFLPTGNIVIAGTTTGVLSGAGSGASDVFIRIYDTLGNVLLTRQFGSPEEDTLKVLEVNGGQIVVVGETAGALVGTSKGGFDGFLRVIDISGAVQFTRQFGTPENEFIFATHVLPDNGYAVVGETNGALSGAGFGGIDTFLRVYNSDGSIRFTRQFGTSSQEKFGASAVAEDGTIAISGSTEGALVGAAKGKRDTFIRVYRSDGSVAFTRQFGTSEDDDIQDMAIDADGSFVVGGITFGLLSGVARGGSDIFVRKYSSTGGISFTRQFGTASDEFGAFLALGSNGVIFIGGTTGGALVGSSTGKQDVFLRSYDEAGGILFTRQFGSPEDEYITTINSY